MTSPLTEHLSYKASYVVTYICPFLTFAFCRFSHFSSQFCFDLTVCCPSSRPFLSLLPSLPLLTHFLRTPSSLPVVPLPSQKTSWLRRAKCFSSDLAHVDVKLTSYLRRINSSKQRFCVSDREREGEGERDRWMEGDRSEIYRLSTSWAPCLKR